MSGNTLNTKNPTAAYTVTMAGQTFTQKDPKGLQYLSVEDHVDMIGVAEVSIGGNQGTEWDSLKIGSDVEIIIGGDDDTPVFVGYITGLRHTYQNGRETLTVLAMDPLVKLASSRNTLVYEKQTDSSIASDVMGAGGVTAGTVDPTSETRDYVFQRNESNLSFLRRLAARNGYVVRAIEGKVEFVAAQFGGSPIEIGKKEVISLDYSFTTRNIPASVTCYGWDYVTKKMVEGSAGTSEVDAIGSSSGTNVTSSLGDIWQGDCHVSDVWVNNQDAAKEMAKSALERMARSFLRGRSVVQGNGKLRTGVMVSFKGHRDGFNPTAYVISVRHRAFAGGGMTSEISFVSNTYPDDATAVDSGTSSDLPAASTSTVASTTSAASPISDVLSDLDSDVADAASDVTDAAADALDDAATAAAAAASAASDAVDDLDLDSLEDLDLDELTEAVDDLAESAGELADDLEEAADELEEELAEATEQLEELGEELEEIGDAAVSAADEVGDAVVSAADDVGDAVVSAAEEVEQVVDEATEVVEEVTEAIDEVEEQVTETVQEVTEAVDEVEEQVSGAVEQASSVASQASSAAAKASSAAAGAEEKISAMAGGQSSSAAAGGSGGGGADSKKSSAAAAGGGGGGGAGQAKNSSSAAAGGGGGQSKNSSSAAGGAGGGQSKNSSSAAGGQSKGSGGSGGGPGKK